MKAELRTTSLPDSQDNVRRSYEKKKGSDSTGSSYEADIESGGDSASAATDSHEGGSNTNSSIEEESDAATYSDEADIELQTLLVPVRKSPTLMKTL